MADSDKPISGNDDLDQTAKLIDAEILDEVATPDDQDTNVDGPEGVSSDAATVMNAEATEESSVTDAPAPESLNAQNPDKKPNWAARSGWGLAALLVAFGGGVVSYPYVAPTLVSLGLIKDTPASTSVAGQVVPDSVLTEIDAVKRRLETLEQKQSDLTTSGDSYQAQLADIAQQLSVLENPQAKSDEAPNVAELTEADDAPQPETLLVPAPPQLDAATLEQIKLNAETLDALKVSLTALEVHLNEMAQPVSNASQQAKDNKALLENLTTELSKRITALELSQTELETGISGIQSEVETLSSGDMQTTPKGRMLVALSHARDKAVTGGEFLSELSVAKADLTALSVLVQSQAASLFDQLTVAANRGVPTKADLLREFDLAAKEALVARDKADKKFLAGLFIGRNKGRNAVGLDAKLNAAEKQLTAGQIDAARAVLDDLDEAPKAAFADWQQQADRHQTVQTSFKALFDLLSGGAN